MTDTALQAWRHWWDEEGSAMRPLPNEDTEQFARRMTEIAWSNGAFKRLADVDLLRALTALVAERDALRKRVAELEAHPPAASDLSAKIDKLSSSVSILTCRVAALESAKLVCPHVPVNPWNPYPTTPWNPYPTTPWIIYGTRTSDRIEESA